MLKANDKRGLSLGAIFALVASLFIAAPAAQANENSVVAYIATGTSSQTSMVHGEGFELKARFGNGVNDRLANPVNSTVAGFGFKITKPDAVTVSYQTSATTTSPRFLSFSPYDTSNTFGMESSKSSETLTLKVVGGTSISTAVSITVTTFIDYDNDGVQDGGELDGNSITITFVPWSSLGAAMTFASPAPGNVGVTASVTLTAGSINWDQLDGKFTIGFAGTEETETGGATYSAIADGGAVTYQLSGAEIEDHAYSFSGAVATAVTSNVAGGSRDSYSATVYYSADTIGSANPSGASNPPKLGETLIATTSVAVESKTFTALSFSTVTSSTLKKTAEDAGTARTNQAFTLKAYGYSGSATTVSVAAAKVLTVSSVTSMDMDADSGVIIQGVTYTSSAALLGATITIPAASSTVAMSTFGQGSTARSIAFELRGQNLTDTFTVNFETPTYTPVYTPTNVAAPAGTALTFGVTVEDQWGAASARTDQRIAASVVLSGSTSTTVSAVVTAGAASVAVSPVPAARTGSATVTLTLQTYNQDTGLWDNGGTDTVAWNVYTSAASDGFVSRTASKSASISYGVVHSWSETIAVTVNNSGSAVAVSAPGLMVRNADLTTQTASDALTIIPTAKVANFQFAATKTGTYTVTFTNGSATTTSQIVVDAAPSNKGASVIWDTTQITPGKTKVITGTVLDANGNPVDTTRAGEAAGDSGTASILVTYTGDAGIVVGTMPTETDADGKFRLSVLTSAADRGTLTLTAVYLADGAATATADKVTSVQAVNVGPAVADSADQKVNAGSFKGYVAVYAKGYAGQRLSAKVGNDWMVVESLASNFERVVEFTGAGYTIAVRIYIDRVLVDTITVTTK